jgi:hypothetical protein
MISGEAKKAIHTGVPVIAGSVAGYLAFKKKASWQVLLIVVAAVIILSWVLTRQVTGLINTALDKPKNIDISQAVGGVIPDFFDARGYAKRLRDDLYGFGFRDGVLYRDLAGMNLSQVAAIDKAWNNEFYVEHKEGLSAAIDADWFSGENYNNAKIFNDRLKSLRNKHK